MSLLVWRVLTNPALAASVTILLSSYGFLYELKSQNSDNPT